MVVARVHLNRKLLFVVNVDWFFVSHRLPIALKAIECGYEVHLACSFSDKRNYLESIGIICHEIAFSRSKGSIKGDLNTIISIRQLLKTVDVDVVHAVTIKRVIYTGLALKCLRHRPAFVAAISGLGYVFASDTLRAKLTKLLVTLMYKFALRSRRRLVIFQNTSDKKLLSDLVGLSEIDSVLIKGSGADLSVYNYRPEPKSSSKVVVMACRLLKEKGVYQFVEAAKIVKAKLPNTEFWLVGCVDKGNPNTVSQQEVDNWVTQGVIRAFGYRDDIPELFAQANIVTMPSYYGEGVPKVLIEASACGRPIVTTDNPGCRESILDEQTGLLVPIKNAEALSNALISLLVDDAKRLDMGRKARQYAVAEFDVKNVVAKHLEVYKCLIEAKQ